MNPLNDNLRPEDIHLSESEKLELRQRVLAFMKKNPVRFRGEVFSFMSRGWEALHSLSLVFTHKLVSRPMVFILSAFIVLGGAGVSYAAEGAMPGDLLYPVKVRVNEEMRLRLARSPQKRAAVMAERVNRRLEEIEALVAAGNINPAQLDAVQNNFQRHTENFNVIVSRLEMNDALQEAAELSADFEAALKAHERILNTLVRRIAPSQPSGFRFLENVKNKTVQAEGVRLRTEKNVSEKPQKLINKVGRKLNATKQKVEQAKQRTSNKKALLSPEIFVQVDQTVKSAEQEIDAGVKAMEKNDLGAAFGHFQNAGRIVREQNFLLDTRDRLRVDLMPTPESLNRAPAGEEGSRGRKEEQEGREIRGKKNGPSPNVRERDNMKPGKNK